MSGYIIWHSLGERYTSISILKNFCKRSSFFFPMIKQTHERQFGTTAKQKMGKAIHRTTTLKRQLLTWSFFLPLPLQPHLHHVHRLRPSTDRHERHIWFACLDSSHIIDGCLPLERPDLLRGNRSQLQLRKKSCPHSRLEDNSHPLGPVRGSWSSSQSQQPGRVTKKGTSKF